MSRGLWFAAGAGAGAYAVTRVRRALDTLTGEGLKDRWHGLTRAARVAGEEVTSARLDREAELRQRFGLPASTGRELSAPQISDAGTISPRLTPTDDDTRDLT